MNTIIIETQPNEARCSHMTETHILELPRCCPRTQNPQQGSTLEIKYRVFERILEVASLRTYVDSYVGGKGDIRSMEGMIQAIAQDCANAAQTTVHVTARLNIEPRQKMILECAAHVR